jgi:hypothetical protein
LLQRSDKAAIRGKADSPRLRLFGTSYPRTPKIQTEALPDDDIPPAAATGPVDRFLEAHRHIPCFDEKFPVPSKKFPVRGQKIPCSAMLRELGYKSLKLLRKLTPIRPNWPGIGKIPC